MCRGRKRSLMCTHVGVLLRKRVGAAFELRSVVPIIATISHDYAKKKSCFRPQNAKIFRCAGLEREWCYAPPTRDVLPISGRTSPSV